jgi:YebC/PmpR family DNA-binding regulatory protein
MQVKIINIFIMAGHSKWKNIQHRKGSQDKLKAKLFTKCSREIISSVKQGGDDPEKNLRLRVAISIARQNNMPNDNIKSAIKKGLGNADLDSYIEVRYNGYVGNVAVIVCATTDNKNRTASDVRSTFTKHGGVMGETGSVEFMFENIGLICFSTNLISYEKCFDLAIELGAENIYQEDDIINIEVVKNLFTKFRDEFSKQSGVDPVKSEIIWKASSTIEISDDQMDSVAKFVEALEDLEDVEDVYLNL